MFKHAYVRGVQNALIQGGHVAFPDDVTATKVADYIANESNIDPLEGISAEVTAKVAEAVIEASQWFAQNGYKAASFSKLASVEDLSKLAHVHVIDLMQKAAEGSTIEGGDKGNKSMSSGEAKMDAVARPEGYAANSRGETEIDTRPGAVGKEEENPAGPHESPMGANSATEQSKAAALGRMIRKLAEGSTILGGDKGNMPEQAISGEAKMDHAMRPSGYATNSRGSTAVDTRPGALGKEMPHPNAPAQSVAGSNSVVEQSKAAGVDDAFLAVFKKTAQEVMPYLPRTASEESKVAHVRACMGMTTEEKAHYIHGLQKEAAEKTAAHVPAKVPPGSRHDIDSSEHSSDATHRRPGAYDGRRANQGGSKHAGEMPAALAEALKAKKDEEHGEEHEDEKHEKMESKAEEKAEHKDEEKKEASLAAQLRRIAASVRA
jgi:hypothetical protein